jgi:hypothetical protein
VANAHAYVNINNYEAKINFGVAVMARNEAICFLSEKMLRFIKQIASKHLSAQAMLIFSQ